MIKNHKGQALIEFVLILPIIILLLLGIMNIGMLFIRKIELENKVVDIIDIWKQQKSSVAELKTLLENENLQFEILENTATSLVTINVSETVSFISPIQTSYSVEVKRVISLE